MMSSTSPSVDEAITSLGYDVVWSIVVWVGQAQYRITFLVVAQEFVGVVEINLAGLMWVETLHLDAFVFDALA